MMKEREQELYLSVVGDTTEVNRHGAARGSTLANTNYQHPLPTLDGLEERQYSWR